jgi:hypothetical protein
MNNDFEDAVQDAAEWKAKCRALEAELAALRESLREQVPVAWQFFDRGYWRNGDDRIKDHRTNTVAGGYAVRDLYAAPVAKQVVMPERDGGHAQKSFWAGFEVARAWPDESNIRAAWNEFKSSDQFARLNANHIEQPRAMVVPEWLKHEDPMATRLEQAGWQPVGDAQWEGA